MKDLLEKKYDAAMNAKENVLNSNMNQANSLEKTTMVAITCDMPIIANPMGKPRKLFSPVIRYGFAMNHTRMKQIIADVGSAIPISKLDIALTC